MSAENSILLPALDGYHGCRGRCSSAFSCHQTLYELVWLDWFLSTVRLIVSTVYSVVDSRDTQKNRRRNRVPARRCHHAEKKSPHPHRLPLLFWAGQEVTLETVRCRGDLPWPPTCRRCCAEASCLFCVSSLCWSVVKRFNPSVSCGAAATSCPCHAQSDRGRLDNTSRQGRAFGAVLSFDAILQRLQHLSVIRWLQISGSTTLQKSFIKKSANFCIQFGHQLTCVLHS